jgi:hypothetical protein
VLAAAAFVAATGCGGSEERRTGPEGQFITVGDTVYQVQLSRLLNQRQRPDSTFLRGQVAAPRNEQYLAVFLTIENEGSKDYLPPRNMEVVDTVGSRYLALDATQSDFALDFSEPVPPGGKAPPADSPAASGPNAGALVLFRVKTESATDNLPLKLRVPVAGGPAAEIELDV